MYTTEKSPKAACASLFTHFLAIVFAHTAGSESEGQNAAQQTVTADVISIVVQKLCNVAVKQAWAETSLTTDTEAVATITDPSGERCGTGTPGNLSSPQMFGLPLNNVRILRLHIH